MGRKITKDELIEHKNAALQKLSNYIDTLINDSNPIVQSKADKLSYWLEDWTTFIDFESQFSPRSLRRYKRGEVIKAHLGYNVGSEEGGLHYCIVIDKKNSINSPVVTIIPLTSVKETTDLANLHVGNIYLGNELFTNLSSKISFTVKALNTRLEEAKAKFDNNKNGLKESQILGLLNDIRMAKREIDLLNKMRWEISKMKKGSIALVNQIRTISKIRIYDPKTNWDILSGVKLSTEKLDLIDKEIFRNFTNKK